MSFDRAASFYDETRGLPEDVAVGLTDVLEAEIAGRGPCLELGIGTGRIALPLVSRGIDLVGVDLSLLMLRRLVAKAGAGSGFALTVGDATAVPFSARSFRVVLASHVLHLIPDWRAAVDEVRRVLQPEGVLIVDFGGAPRAPWGAEAHKIMASTAGVVRLRPGASLPEDVAAHLGVAPRALQPLPFTSLRTLAQDLRDWRDQIHSWTWPYTPSQMAAATAAVESEAMNGRWELDTAVSIERTVQWWAFELDGG